MRRLFIAAVAILLSCGAGLAQSPMTTPGMGVTSPLGTPGSTSPGFQTGIPLGATELNPGGLGPTAISPMSSSTSSGCVGMASSSSGIAGISGMAGSAGMTGSSGMAGGAASATLGTPSSFDGGGVGSMGSASTSSGCSTTPSSGTVSSAGTASPLSNPAGATTTGLNGAIPLGSTEINSLGVSPLIGASSPSSTTTPCVSTLTTGMAGTSSTGVMAGTLGAPDPTTGSTSAAGVTPSPGC
jgi:hypothetical protein